MHIFVLQILHKILQWFHRQVVPVIHRIIYYWQLDGCALIIFLYGYYHLCFLLPFLLFQIRISYFTIPKKFSLFLNNLADQQQIHFSASFPFMAVNVLRIGCYRCWKVFAQILMKIFVVQLQLVFTRFLFFLAF